MDDVIVVEGHVIQEIILSHSVSLSWTASTDIVDGYFVYRGTTAGGESTTPLNAIVVGATTYTDTTVPGPGTYFYTVKASVGGVLSIASNEVSTVILPAPPSALVVTAHS
jgi:hypothetical protein